tara:strand:- start:332 stop:451 length:120 start_codon:yes stop_codon:yes gene_type:complete
MDFLGLVLLALSFPVFVYFTVSIEEAIPSWEGLSAISIF